MYDIMKRLIENKFYETKEEAEQKLNVFYAMNRLTDIVYVELSQLTETTYNPPVETPITE